MRIAIIGAGAAGLMCAATILENAPDSKIFLIERNHGLGKKVIISGGGRCNVTTGIQAAKLVLNHYPRGNKFLTSAMHAFPPGAVYEWFESHGVPLKTQEDNRVFPRSDDGHDIVGVFEKLFQAAHIPVSLNTHVIRVEKKETTFLVYTKGQDAPLLVDRLVLTTGGQAYRQTGSTGDGYAFAQALGHTITPLAPSLNAFFTREKWPAEISGVSFSHARLTAKRGREFSFTGPFLFTHKGVSGPAVFALSSLVAFEQYNATIPLDLSIDLFPELSLEALRAQCETLLAQHGHKQLKSVLALLVPKSLSDILLRELAITHTLAANQTPKKDRERILAWLKAIPLTVIQRGAGDEFVTAGGVSLKEVNPSTMESKICPGLFFAGEILDVDGFTGGFNLQASWATGHLVGQSIEKGT